MILEKMLIGAINNLNQIHMDLGDELDRAYQSGYSKGHHDGRKEGYTTGFDEGVDCVSNKYEAYQKGLNEAWDAARKIAQQWEEETNTEHRVVIDDSIRITLDSMTASEAIAKLKAYEKQKEADEPIKVGDIVDWGGEKYIVTYIDDTDGCVDLLFLDAGSTCERVSPDCFTRTGRHFDIDKILEEMKHED